ncbi:hypothetical protein GCM10027347_19080 [Larkinella harenae]
MSFEAQLVSGNMAQLEAFVGNTTKPKRMTRGKKSSVEQNFDKDFLMMMANSQLECWASLIVTGQKVKVLLFNSGWLSSVLRDFRRDGWIVHVAHKPIEPPPRTYYYFSHPGFKDKLRIAPN